MPQDVFQQKMDMILEQCPETIRLIDDVVVYGRIKEVHEQNFHNPMTVAKHESLSLNSAKCVVDQKEIHFFAVAFSENSLHPDLHKVDGIKLLPSPNNVAELQKLLEIITCMAPFIFHCSDLTLPLKKLLKVHTTNGQVAIKNLYSK